MAVFRKQLCGFYNTLSGWIESKWFLPACLGLGFVVRLLWILGVHNVQVSDFHSYLVWGKSIAAGHGMILNGHPTAYYPMGYPVFLGLVFKLFGGHMLAAKAANAVLYIGIIYLAFLLAQELFRSRFVAGCTALFLAFEPGHIAYTSILVSETLFTFLLLLGSWLLLSSRGRVTVTLLGGAVFGVANVVRPLASAAMIVVFAYVCFSYAIKLRPRRLALLTTVLVIGHVLAIMPYGVRNYVSMHRFTFVSLNSGWNLMVGNNPYATGMYPNGYSDYRRVLALVPYSRDEFEFNNRLNRYAVNYMVHHPARTGQLAVKKLFYLYASEVDGVRRNLDGLPNRGGRLKLLMPVTQAYYMVLVFGFIYATILLLRTRKKMPTSTVPMLGIWLVVMWSVVHMIIIGSARYHYPIVPWFAMYAAAALHYFCSGGLTSKGSETAGALGTEEPVATLNPTN